MIKKIIISSILVSSVLLANSDNRYSIKALSLNKEISENYSLFSSSFDSNYTEDKEYNRIIPCSNIPKEDYIKDKWFSNLKYYQLIVCNNFIYRADIKKWVMKN